MNPFCMRSHAERQHRGRTYLSRRWRSNPSGKCLSRKMCCPPHCANNLPRVSRSCEHFPDGFDLHILLKCSQERLPRCRVISTTRREAHRSGCARCGAGAGCSDIVYQSLRGGFIGTRLGTKCTHSGLRSCHQKSTCLIKLT